MNWKGTGEGGDLPSNPHATNFAWRAEEGFGAGLPLLDGVRRKKIPT
jgi:hypothetical protein